MNLKYIKNIEQFETNSWKKLSCLMYEPDDKLFDKQEIIKIRKQMLTTIKAYDFFYQDDKAIIDILDVEDDVLALKELEKIKYIIRNNFVLNTDKNYIKFLNLTDDILCSKLIDINIEDLKIEHIRLASDGIMEDNDYKLAYFNCIHFPGAEVELIEKDLNIIMSNNILSKKL